MALKFTKHRQAIPSRDWRPFDMGCVIGPWQQIDVISWFGPRVAVIDKAGGTIGTVSWLLRSDIRPVRNHADDTD